ncbi:MAG: zf-TFIIB domain-containing protein [Geobacter sp.]|nr:zf-TFIIB domain-containing protein [Geobacter sp.]
MALCSSCSAPLPVNVCLCSYCGTRNDMNFTADRFSVSRDTSRRVCPDCTIALQTVRVNTGAGVFAIDRCERCYGLFFDMGEAQAFLEASVTPAFAVNFREIATINEERGSAVRQVRYIKCPECGVLMNRINFGARSGVVVDQCKDHGVWLDNGELVHLMEWKKAGGQLLDQKERVEQQRQREYIRPVPSYPMSGYPETSPAGDLLATACTVLLDTLFR